MKYVDGFVFVVPKKNLPAYKKMAALGGKVWKEYGALDYKECIGEEMIIKGPPGMQMLMFPKLTNAKKDEIVCFSYITFKNKAHRNRVNAKVMKDKRMNEKMEMPFDPKHMAYGGFETIVDL